MRTLPESLSVVAPCYNEAEGIYIFYETLWKVLDSIGIGYEIVLVDDGSQDDTLTQLNAIADDDDSVSVIALSRNYGHQAALTAGLDQASGEVVITMDSDLQHPPAVIPELLAWYERGADIVYAARQPNANVGLLKRTASSGYYWLFRRMTNIEVIPGAADFRLMSATSVQALSQMREMHRYLRGMVPWLGFTSAIVYYEQPERFAGTSAYTWRKSWRLARHGLFSFSTIPLVLITYLGLGTVALGLLYFIWVLTVWGLGYTIPGWASMIGVTLLMGGVQLISIGIIAQYIGMIFEQTKNRPLYVIKHHHRSQAVTRHTAESESHDYATDPSTSRTDA